MRITDILSVQSIQLGANLTDKSVILDTLIDLQQKNGVLKNKAKYKEAVLAREAQMCTAIERGIAVPHAKCDAVTSPALSAITLKTPIECGAIDGVPTDLFFMIAAPLDNDLHIEILSHLMTLLMDDGFAVALRNARNELDFLRIINDAEKEKFSEKNDEIPTAKGYNVLAVTACPTGIAHTFMAAEALQQAATKFSCTIKVETCGSESEANTLTQSDIDLADGIIVASDITVDITRFNGKRVLFTSVSSGIHNAEQLIEKIEDGTVPVFHAKPAIDEEGETFKLEKSFVAKMYNHLMNGVSHMLPFVVSGGILIALSYMIDDISMNPANFGMNTPLAAFFKSIGTCAFNFMLPILSAYIAFSIAGRPGLAVGFVGGAISYSGISFVNFFPVEGLSGGFLGAIIAGFVAGCIVLFLRKVFLFLPKSMNGIKPVLLYPLFGTVLVGAVICLLNPEISSLSNGLTYLLNGLDGTSRVLLGIILGALMSSDMGGPISKTAYIFGTAAISMANYDIMAAVMLGGMTPPLVIAFCATIFRNKFTKGERKGAFLNYIFGLCFITEGAIPFAASDAFRVLPSCIVGSAISGGLSMLFKCKLYSPHGGIFVFPIVEHVFPYMFSLLVGSLVGALILGAIRKDKKQD